MWTDEERAIYMRNYRRANRDQINAYRRAYYYKHKEAILERQKKFETSHPTYRKTPEYKEKNALHHKRWVEKNRDHLREYQRNRYQKKKLEAIMAERNRNEQCTL
jgi:hypothetical protein